MDEQEKSPEQPLSELIATQNSLPTGTFIEILAGDYIQHFWVPEVTDDIKKHAFDTQGLIPAVLKR